MCILTALHIAFGGCLAVAQGAAKRDSVTRIINEARFHEDALTSRNAETFEARTNEDDEDTNEVVLTP